MHNPAFTMNNVKWSAWEKCCILDGVIYINSSKENDSENMEYYYPFDYYRAPVPEHLVNYILGRKGNSYKGLYLHHLFASLDCSDKEQVKRWVEKFGPLYSPWENFEENGGAKVELFPFYDAYATFKRFMEAGKDFKKLISGDPVQGGELDWDDMIFESREDRLEYTFDSTKPYLAGISPVLVMRYKEPGQRPVLEWDWAIPDLISALYFMLFLDLTTKGGPYKCADPRCGNFFYPEDLRGEPQYCSPECQNRVNQRNNKARKKKVRLLWREGKSPEEIARATGIKIEQITTWVSTFKR
ncbi:MAG: CGNR zinc finger domain-containing protein [Syntrophomonadaceae bacterium]|nr:CGNR zinc finger domain-containing protein [Syntrophomonadaceae bacterium]MDD4549414.1 CGNR zinc finger domain-containing protein [Syntrophomonadaceae bacterium]